MLKIHYGKRHWNSPSVLVYQILYICYVDDIFTVWYYGKEDLKIYLNTIKLSPQTQIHNRNWRTGRKAITVYWKPTPDPILSGFLIGEKGLYSLNHWNHISFSSSLNTSCHFRFIFKLYSSLSYTMKYQINVSRSSLLRTPYTVNTDFVQYSDRLRNI